MNRVVIDIKYAMEEASKKISIFSKKRIEVIHKGIQVISLHETIQLLQKYEEAMVNVKMNLSDEPSILYLMFLTKEARSTISEVMFGKYGNNNEHIQNSIIQEIGNVFGTTIANNVSRSMNKSIHTTVPEVIVDLAEAILNSAIVNFEFVNDKLIYMDTSVFVDNVSVNCYIYLLFEHTFLDSIFYKNDTVNNVSNNKEIL